MVKFDLVKDPISLFTAAFFVDLVFAFWIRYYLGKPINDWYDQFRFSAVLADVLSIIIGILMGYLIYTKLILKENQEFNMGIFIITCIGFQLIHDLFFYYAVIKPIPRKHNDMIDVFKDYSESGGVGILLIDAIMIISTIGIFYLMHTEFDDLTKLISFAVVLYAIQYIIYTDRKKT